MIRRHLGHGSRKKGTSGNPRSPGSVNEGGTASGVYLILNSGSLPIAPLHLYI